MSRLSKQGTWIRIEHQGKDYVFCVLTVTRVDVLKGALTIHQQGLHEWIRIDGLPEGAALKIRDAILDLDPEGWA